MVILYITLIQKVFFANFVLPPWSLFAVQLYQGLHPWAHLGRLHQGLPAAACTQGPRPGQLHSGLPLGLPAAALLVALHIREGVVQGYGVTDIFI